MMPQTRQARIVEAAEALVSRFNQINLQRDGDRDESQDEIYTLTAILAEAVKVRKNGVPPSIDTQDVVRRLESGESQSSIARALKVTRQLINHIARARQISIEMTLRNQPTLATIAIGARFWVDDSRRDYWRVNGNLCKWVQYGEGAEILEQGECRLDPGTPIYPQPDLEIADTIMNEGRP